MSAVRGWKRPARVAAGTNPFAPNGPWHLPHGLASTEGVEVT
ncbi:MAG: hypothetical protein ACXVHJ_35715 [Solirubrobacteraceae bacterium]